MSPNQPATVRTGEASVPSPAPSKVVTPIVTSTSATEPGTSATHLVAAESARRTPSLRSRTSTAGEGREHAEVDRERLPAREPLLGPEQDHGDEGVGAVGERRDGGRVRGQADGLKAALAVDELEPAEGDDPGDRGPAAEALRIGERRRRGLAGDQLEDAADEPGDGAPRVKRAEDVAEEDAEDDEPEPGGDEDEGDREVAVRRLGAVEPRPDRDPEQEDAERPGEHLGDAVDEQRRDPFADGAPVGLLEAADVCQATESPKNETTRTSEAAQANSQAGIGRSWRPTSAWPTTRTEPQSITTG